MDIRFHAWDAVAFFSRLSEKLKGKRALTTKVPKTTKWAAFAAKGISRSIGMEHQGDRINKIADLNTEMQQNAAGAQEPAAIMGILRTAAKEKHKGQVLCLSSAAEAKIFNPIGTDQHF